MYPAPPAIRIFINCLLVPFLDTTKVPVSITYAYGTILAVREEQSPALKKRHLPEARCLLQPFPFPFASLKLGRRQRSNLPWWCQSCSESKTTRFESH